MSSVDAADRDDRLYFRQLLAGRDFATSDRVARQMVNFVYLIGDRATGEALVVDPAYDIRGLLDVAAADGMRITGALATHYHPDHVGGDMMGYRISGVRELLTLNPVPIHVQRDESPWVQRVTGASESDLVLHDSGDVVTVGDLRVELIHTPGHTPGSQCFFVDGRYLVSGDTLFLEGCGRTDLPGGDPAQLYESLTKKLARIPDDAILFPGHLYSAEPSATMGETRRMNFVFKPRTEAEWLAMFGR
jgi:glyoxylase-like metal-dependent hydrolase (beta-lactamase superfamily II)